MVDLGITSNLDHLHANILYITASVNIPSIFGEETCLEITIVRVHLTGGSDWANPLNGIGRTSGISSISIDLVGKTDDSLRSSEDLRSMISEIVGILNAVVRSRATHTWLASAKAVREATQDFMLKYRGIVILDNN